VAVSIEGRRIVPIATDPQFSEGRPRFSPDGRWVVFDSDRTGRQEVYLQAFPGPAPPIRISNRGGWMALWSRDGREILYRENDQVMAVHVTLGPRVTAGVPRMSFRLPMPGAVSGVGRFSAAPDGQGFIATIDASPDTPWRAVVVSNWIGELKR
jgi:dipeptidyl aminopeptidase/acylaminoacyl peptidase